MRQRVEQLVPGCRVWISTFHSLGARLVRQYADHFNLDKNFTIYDQEERKRLVKMALEDAGIDNSRFTPDNIQGAISKAKNQLIGPERYAGRANDFFSQVVARVYPAYEKRMRECNALDFDDLLCFPALALKNDTELRAELDARFRFVLIDEYQDTNHAQYAIARYLSIDQPNLCVVGDPDQSIYGWRGSDIRNILDFERDFPTTRVLTLTHNYRSTKSILRAAGHLISHNRQRKPKDLVTDNAQGQPVTLLTYETGIDEAEGIARRIRRAVEAKQHSYRDFAVFVRMNALTRALESAFVKHRVPFQIVKGLAFFDRKENRDVLAYLRLLVNPRDDLSFLRIVNEPTRGIGKTSLDHLREYAEPRELSLLAAAAEVKNVTNIKGKASKGLTDFSQMMRELHGRIEGRPDEVIREVLDRSGYRHMLTDSRDEEDAERLANVEELITAAKQFSDEDSSRTVGDFLENITLASDVDGWDERQDCVSVMTMHAAKGLEFPVVFIAAVEDGILPHEPQPGKGRSGRGGEAPGLRRHYPRQGGVLSDSCTAARIPRHRPVCHPEPVPRRVTEGCHRGDRRVVQCCRPAAGDGRVARRRQGGGAGLAGRRGAAEGEARADSAGDECRRRWPGGRDVRASSAVRAGAHHRSERLRGDAAGQGAFCFWRREDAGGGAREADHPTQGMMPTFVAMLCLGARFGQSSLRRMLRQSIGLSSQIALIVSNKPRRSQPSSSKGSQSRIIALAILYASVRSESGPTMPRELKGRGACAPGRRPCGTPSPPGGAPGGRVVPGRTDPPPPGRRSSRGQTTAPAVCQRTNKVRDTQTPLFVRSWEEREGGVVLLPC